MASFNQVVGELLDRIDRIKSASDLDDPGQHPVSKLDNNTQPPVEGDHGKENDEKLREQIEPNTLETKTPTDIQNQLDQHAQRGLKTTDVGGDPETESAEPRPALTDSTHPARSDNDELDGHKYAHLTEEEMRRMSVEELAVAYRSLAEKTAVEVATDLGIRSGGAGTSALPTGDWSVDLMNGAAPPEAVREVLVKDAAGFLRSNYESGRRAALLVLDSALRAKQAQNPEMDDQMAAALAASGASGEEIPGESAGLSEEGEIPPEILRLILGSEEGDPSGEAGSDAGSAESGPSPEEIVQDLVAGAEQADQIEQEGEEPTAEEIAMMLQNSGLSPEGLKAAAMLSIGEELEKSAAERSSKKKPISKQARLEQIRQWAKDMQKRSVSTAD